MKTQLKYSRCGNCEHALISGVACDSGPADCPQMIEDKPQKRRATMLHLRALARTMALPSEYDAVRGSE